MNNQTQDSISHSLSPTDTLISILYLLSVPVVGLIVTFSRKQNVNTTNRVLDSYYLGKKILPWWALAVADVSSYIDISGTMINTALLYAFGAKGIYIEIRGGLCIMLAFQLALTGKLSRRCPVRTKGEWIKFRFGQDSGAKVARIAVATVCLLSSVLSIAYFAIGGGKFVSEFITIPNYLGISSETWTAAALMILAMAYTIMGGFSAVVYTDVYQSVFIFSAFIYVAIVAVQVSLPSQFFVYLPMWGVERDTSPYSEWKHRKTEVELEKFWYNRTSWVSATPVEHLSIPSNSSYSIYDNFWSVLVCYTMVTFMRSSSGPGGSGLQTVLATKSVRDVQLQTMAAMILLALRWAFSAGVAVLIVVYTNEPNSPTMKGIDPERVVPWVINSVLPIGAKGIVFAALLAAGMTTFDSALNAGSSYWTIDIYQAFISPSASPKALVLQARLSTAILCIIGLLFSTAAPSINRIWGMMTMALGGGTVWAYFLSWYWHRFNAFGCVSGLLSGVLATFVVFIWFPYFPEYTSFLITFTCSGVVCFFVTFSTKCTDASTLRNFYRHVRPPGIWGKVQRQVVNINGDKDLIHDINIENRKDLFSVVLVVMTQLLMYILSVSVVFKSRLVITLAPLFFILSTVMYFSWYLRLEKVTKSELKLRTALDIPFETGIGRDEMENPLLVHSEILD